MTASSIQTGTDSATDYATLQFVVTSILSRVATTMPVKVISCTNNGGLSPWGTVDVQPLIGQVFGNNAVVQHGQLFSIPYVRIQGGANAVIIDPQPGDIGIACFCSRDISSLKQQSAIDQIKSGDARGTSPASARQYNMSDGIYLGGILNAQPTQYVRFSDESIEVVSTTKIKLSAPEIEINASSKVTIESVEVDVTGSSKVVVDSPANDIKGGATKIDNKVFLTHTHSGVMSGGSNSGPVT